MYIKLKFGLENSRGIGTSKTQEQHFTDVVFHTANTCDHVTLCGRNHFENLIMNFEMWKLSWIA